MRARDVAEGILEVVGYLIVRPIFLAVSYGFVGLGYALYATLQAVAYTFIFAVRACMLALQALATIIEYTLFPIFQIVFFAANLAYRFALRVRDFLRPIFVGIFRPLDNYITPKVVSAVRFIYSYVVKPIITLPDLYSYYINRPLAARIDRLSLAIRERLQHRFPRLGYLLAITVGISLHFALVVARLIIEFQFFDNIALRGLKNLAISKPTLLLITKVGGTLGEIYRSYLGFLNYDVLYRTLHQTEIPELLLAFRDRPLRSLLEVVVEPVANKILDSLTKLAERVLPWRFAAAELRVAKAEQLRQAQQVVQEAQDAVLEAEAVAQQFDLTPAHTQHAALKAVEAAQHVQAAQQALQAVHAATSLELVLEAMQQVRAAAAQARTAAASAAVDPEDAARAQRARDGAARVMRAVQMRTRLNQAHNLARFAELEPEEEVVIENEFTEALDRAIAANDFSIVLNYLRQRAGTADPVLLNWTEYLRNDVKQNKYTAKGFWSDVTAEERSCLEDFYPGFCCVISHELMRVPVYLIKQPQGLRTYLNFMDLLAAINTVNERTRRPVVQNPETREPITSLDSIHYDKERHDQIKAAIAKMRDYRTMIEAAIASNDFRALLQDIQAQDPRELDATAAGTKFNILWHPKLEAQLQQQTSAAHQDLTCNISGTLMRHPVQVRAANGAVYNYDLLPLLNALRSSNVLPIRNGDPNTLRITSLSQIIYPAAAQELHPVNPADSADTSDAEDPVSPVPSRRDSVSPLRPAF